MSEPVSDTSMCTRTLVELPEQFSSVVLLHYTANCKPGIYIVGNIQKVTVQFFYLTKAEVLKNYLQLLLDSVISKNLDVELPAAPPLACSGHRGFTAWIAA